MENGGEVTLVISEQEPPKTRILTLFRMGFFGAAHGWGGAKRPPVPKICHTSYNDETWHSHALPKEDQKNI